MKNIQMFVLNTNKQTPSKSYDVYDYSNYPDFSQCLGFIQGSFTTSGALIQTPEGGFFPIALTVGSKAINFLFINTGEDSLFGTLGSGTIGSNGQIDLLYGNTVGNTDRTIRRGSAGQLKAGHTVGKSFKYYGRIYKGANVSSVSRIKISVGLLHTDGTITYCGNNVTITSLETVANTKTRTLYEFTDSGIVSQDGDRIIVEINTKVNLSSSGSGSIVALKTGYLGNNANGPLTMSEEAPSPFQISVE